MSNPNIESIALRAASTIMDIKIAGPRMLGKNTQLKAAIQCAVTDAIKEHHEAVMEAAKAWMDSAGGPGTVAAPDPARLRALTTTIQNAYIGYTGENLDAGPADAIARVLVQLEQHRQPVQK